jgi:pSer/pThr/pTyr-binding forkhead associated (FHA) protein
MARIALKELESDRSLAVEQLESLIGRDPACGFVIEGPKSKVVSGRHARIFFQDNTWWIQDMSRNGTILDDERLQNGQRHALKVGQLIGLGESGPRLQVTSLESRAISETMVEQTGFGAPPQTTAPRQRPMGGGAPTSVSVNEGTPAMRKPEAVRAGVKAAEPTEPARLTGTWHLAVKLRATHSDQRFESKATVVKVGRSPECGIRVPPEQGASVSRVHAEIAVGDAGVVVRDAGSRNGTYLNGVRIEGAQPLIIGDKLTLGTGGPTLEVEELHIVKGVGPQDAVSPRIAGSTTPDAFPARRAGEALRELPTAPSAVADLKRAVPPGTRPVPPPDSPARDVPQQPSPANAPIVDRSRLAIYLALGVLIVALAIIIGRITVS